MSTNSQLKTLAPDVGALVEYGLDGYRARPATYRVSGWMKERPVEPTSDELIDQGVTDIGRILRAILYETQQEVQGKKMIWCTREEATHLSLTGVCGAIAPIEACKVVGRVDWSEKQIDEERKYALKLAADRTMVD